MLFRFIRTRISRLVALVADSLIHTADAMNVAATSLTRFERRLA